ncbi:Electron transfer flavoprotein alpha subunit [Rhodomicrobium vannielii ATCC 17100]|uniref:Electron transfer flavoprotein subunit alpha n=1 Tax=Rhodomicrobium vannielii (strain ATCC 17100 / DSM 162 / LMG 4299 / NCIMB 10020 / ATH 3.1.1) TaxID=648757 RepID=E3I434_RHOVT|nr:FAD-binding protein [Rhodomicrobium vannielii]ADP72683.1 Electron transfer flavoprotein alpha subunit [Rhodomicrobium vannielii ATCC 17100]
MAVLLVAEHNNKALNGATAKALTAAKALGAPVHVLVAGADVDAVAQKAAALEGVDKVLVADASHLAAHLAEDLAALIVPLMANHDALVVVASTTGKNFAPRVAALLDVPQISEATAILSPTQFERPIYAGNAIQTVEVTVPKKVLTIRTTAFAAAPEGGSAAIEKIDAPAQSELAKFVGEDISQSARPDLTAAKVVVSGGRGLGSADNFKLIERIADKLGAAVGASRAAVDAGFIPGDFQVGQTGKVVAPELYIAVGISGAIQHLAGMKDSKVIVAINKDEEAPIFQVADYGLVGDLFQILPEIEAALDSRK